MKKKKNNASHDEQQVAVVPAVAAQADEVVVAQSEENDASQGTRQKGRKKEKAKVKTSTFERGMIILVRLVVGGVFVMSGFVKAIDPWGSVYKFQEYLMALGWESMLGDYIVAFTVLGFAGLFHRMKNGFLSPRYSIQLLNIETSDTVCDLISRLSYCWVMVPRGSAM